MTIYEFYMTYILTGKAVFLSTNLSPLRVSMYGDNLRLYYQGSIGNSPIEIELEHNPSITALSACGIKIALITDTVFIDASTLTDVISIPVPIPDDLPF